jgi:hypothetical protein
MKLRLGQQGIAGTEHAIQSRVAVRKNGKICGVGALTLEMQCIAGADGKGKRRREIQDQGRCRRIAGIRSQKNAARINLESIAESSIHQPKN